MASPLAYRDFRWLWAGSMCSWAGQWTQQAALGWVVYEITGSGTLLGAVIGVRAIPMVLLTPLSGVAADRYDRQRLLQASQALAAAVSFALGAALAMGFASTPMLFAFTLLMGAANVMDRPARFTTAFELVPRQIAVKAVALNTIGFSIMRVLGPAAAGYLIATVGAAGSFFVQGILYAAAGLMAFFVLFPARRPAPQRSALHDMREGLGFALRDPATRLLLVLGALPFFLLIPVFGTLYPIYAKDVFLEGPKGLGLLLTAVGAGGLLGGFLANMLAHVERQALMQAGWALLMAAAILAIAASPTLAIAMVFSFVGGMAEMAHSSSNLAMLQMAAPEAMRGRIASLSMLYPALISLGGLAAGVLSDLVGVRGASATLACIAIAAVAAIYFLSPNLKELKLK
ncbi:MAG: MFS transporter [Betaproteobacteria bacterium]